MDSSDLFFLRGIRWMVIQSNLGTLDLEVSGQKKGCNYPRWAPSNHGAHRIFLRIPIGLGDPLTGLEASLAIQGPGSSYTLDVRSSPPKLRFGIFGPQKRHTIQTPFTSVEVFAWMSRVPKSLRIPSPPFQSSRDFLGFQSLPKRT